MSYPLDKFLYRTTRSRARLRAYLADRAGYVERWCRDDAGHLLGTEQTTGQTLDPAERDALVRLDTAALRARGAHPELVHRLEALAATSARPED